MRKSFRYLAILLVLSGLGQGMVFAQADLGVTKPGWPVYAPLTGQVWQLGKTYEISWDPGQIADPEVNIYLYNATCLSSVCVALAPLNAGLKLTNNGKYLWTLPQDLNSFYTGSQYLKIQGYNFPNLFITSQNFTVTPMQAEASFGFPGKGSILQVGQEYMVKWSGAKASSGEKLKLAPYYACLYTSPACALAEPQPQVIATDLANKTEVTWQVSPMQFLGDVRLQLVSGSGEILATSEVFSIANKLVDSQQLVVSGRAQVVVKVGGQISEEYVALSGSSPFAWTWIGDPSLSLALQARAIQCIKAPCPTGDDIAVLTGTASSVGVFPVTIRVQDSKGASAEQGLRIIVQPAVTVANNLPPGQIIRTPDKAIRLILDNQEFYEFPSMEDFASKGYRFYQVQHKPRFDLTKYSSHAFYRPSGTTFRYEGERTVYYLTSEYCKQAYTSYPLFLAWRVRLVDIVTLKHSEMFPTCEKPFVTLPDYTAVKGQGRTVYLHEKGQLRPVTSASSFTALGFKFSDVLTLNSSELSQYAVGEEVK